jgi:hypothetical protein
MAVGHTKKILVGTLIALALAWFNPSGTSQTVAALREAAGQISMEAQQRPRFVVGCVVG